MCAFQKLFIKQLQCGRNATSSRNLGRVTPESIAGETSVCTMIGWSKLSPAMTASRIQRDHSSAYASSARQLEAAWVSHDCCRVTSVVIV